MEKKIIYSEPANFFPKSVRKANKIGEFAEIQTNESVKQEKVSDAEMADTDKI